MKWLNLESAWRRHGIGRAEKKPVQRDGVGLSFEDSQMLLEFLILLDQVVNGIRAPEEWGSFLQPVSSPTVPVTSKVDKGTTVHRLQRDPLES